MQEERLQLHYSRHSLSQLPMGNKKVVRYNEWFELLGHSGTIDKTKGK